MIIVLFLGNTSFGAERRKKGGQKSQSAYTFRYKKYTIPATKKTN